MKRGFSASTAVLVALLLGVLIWVGKIVNPPEAKGEHDHSEEEAAASQQPQPATPKPVQGIKGEKTPAVPQAAGLNTQAKPVAEMSSPAAPAGPAGKDRAAMMAQMGKMPGGAAGMDKATMMAKMQQMHGGARKVKPAVPDGMDPAMWRERDMGAVTPQQEPKK